MTNPELRQESILTESQWFDIQEQVAQFINNLKQFVSKSDIASSLRSKIKTLFTINSQPYEVGRTNVGDGFIFEFSHLSDQRGRAISLSVNKRMAPYSLVVSDKFEGQEPEWVDTRFDFQEDKLTRITQTGPDRSFFPIQSSKRDKKQIVELQKNGNAIECRIGWFDRSEDVWFLIVGNNLLEFPGQAQINRVDFTIKTANVTVGGMNFLLNPETLIRDALASAVSFRQAVNLTPSYLDLGGLRANAF